MGVEDDATTRDGVLPVVLGVKDATGCPTAQGYTYQQTSGALADSTDDWSYATLNDNSSIFGSMSSQGYGGKEYNSVQFHGTYQINYCFKFYPLTGKPHVTLRALTYSNCPAGYVSLDVAQINGWNSNAYYQKTGSTVYLGGLYTNAYNDSLDGFVYDSITTSNKVCVLAENVAAFP
jgi:hypothetical protein